MIKKDLTTIHNIPDDSINGSVGWGTTYINDPEKKPNEYGLLPNEIKKGLEGLIENNFDIRLLSKRYKDEAHNGGKDFEDICEKTSYEEFKKFEMFNIKLLFEDLEFRKLIDKKQTIIDYGCGNGKILEYFIKRYGDSIHTKEVKLIDINPGSLYKAKNAVPECDFALMGDFLSDQVGTTTNNNLNLSLGGGLLNMSLSQIKEFRQKLGGSGELLIIGVFHDIQDNDPEEEGIDTLPKYRGSLQERQIYNCLRTLGFDDKMIELSTFDANRSARDEHGNKSIEVGFIPTADFTVNHKDNSYNFRNGKKYILLKSPRVTKNYITNIIHGWNTESLVTDEIIKTVKSKYMTHYVISLCGQPRKNNDFWTRSSFYLKNLPSSIFTALFPIALGSLLYVNSLSESKVSEKNYKYKHELLSSLQLDQRLFDIQTYNIEQGIINEEQYKKTITNLIIDKDNIFFTHNSKSYQFIKVQDLNKKYYNVRYDIENKSFPEYKIYEEIQTRYRNLYKEFQTRY